MEQVYGIHKAQGGFVGRQAKTTDKAVKKGQAIGVVMSEGNYSDRSRTYVVNVKMNGSWTQQIAKAIGVVGSGQIPRYKAGDRVLLNFPDTGSTDQITIVGPTNEVTGQGLPKVVNSAGGNRNALPNDPNFDQSPDANVVSQSPNYLELINEPFHKLVSDIELVEDRPDRTRQSAGDSEQMESAIIREAEGFLSEAKQDLSIAQSKFGQTGGYKFLNEGKKLTTHHFLDISSAKVTKKKAELDLEEADIDRKHQEEMNECLEKRNQQIREGLENLREELTDEALEKLNGFLPDFLQVSIDESDEPGELDIKKVTVGPFTLNTENGTIDVEREDNLKYKAASKGLSVLNQTLPPYLQVCVKKSGLVGIGDYGKVDLQQLIKGDGLDAAVDTEIAGVDVEAQIQDGNVQASIGPFNVNSDSISINDQASSVANQALDGLNQSLPEPLEISVNDGLDNLSLGPFSLDLESFEFSFDKSALSGTLEFLQKRFFPAPFELEISPDFETVSLGPVTWNTDNQRISVLEETIFIDKDQCKKDKAQSNPALTESPREEKKRDSPDKSPLPPIPPLPEPPGPKKPLATGDIPTAGEGGCNSSDALKNLFEPQEEQTESDAYRFDTPAETDANVILSEEEGYKEYADDNVGNEAGIISDGEFDSYNLPEELTIVN